MPPPLLGPGIPSESAPSTPSGSPGGWHNGGVGPACLLGCLKGVRPRVASGHGRCGWAHSIRPETSMYDQLCIWSPSDINRHPFRGLPNSKVPQGGSPPPPPPAMLRMSPPPIHKWRIPASKGKQVRAHGGTKRHTPPAPMAAPPFLLPFEVGLCAL